MLTTKTYILILFVLITGLSSTAQKTALFSGSYQSIKFPALMEEVQKQTGYSIFYNSSFLDTFSISINAKEMDVLQLFTTILSGTSYHFSEDAFKNIYITYQQPLIVALPEDFFDKSNKKPDSTHITDVAKEQL